MVESNLYLQMETSDNDPVSRGLLKIETQLIKTKVKESDLRLVTGPTESICEEVTQTGKAY